MKVVIYSNLGEKIEQLLNTMVLPITPTEVCGLDGHTYSLEIRRGFASININWWCKAEDGWEPLNDVLELVFSVLPKDSRKYTM